ncbi:MAG TPA: prepilin-type N-terminal cleavage/methylation domain-containing protein [Protaetiibacter sp.]|nr:prepilin-type N-terminal cleavage/methylation domain-containing protein [Protaetiibacter sp.]
MSARIVRDERGVTMVEMIVVMLITSVILLAIGSMYISTLQVQRTVVALSESTNAAQLVARSVDDGVRNGVELRPLATGTDGGQLLVVCTAGAQAALSHSWQAWYWSPEGAGTLRTKIFSPGLPPGVPDAATLATWTLLLTNVEPRGGGVFSADPASGAVGVHFSTFGDDTDATTIEFTTHLAPHPTPASPSEEPCS